MPPANEVRDGPTSPGVRIVLGMSPEHAPDTARAVGPSASAGGFASALALHADPAVARGTTSRLRAEWVRAFPALADGTLDALRYDHLQSLFAAYDRACFGGLLARRLAEAKTLPLVFRMSSRLTSAGGKTTRRTWPDRDDPHGPRFVAYEIAFSSLLLFESFRGEERQVVVCGVPCRDRLDAFLRLFEHEVTHLFEFLDRGASDCRAPPFRYVASRLFGHEASTHDLVTRRERARVELGIRVGDRVSFVAPEGEFTGVVERITRRATVRVELPVPGDRCVVRRYYVPLPLLTRAA